jgi:DNA-binding response OmpR family regulator
MSRIVIIEEDKLIRGLLVEWLSAAGYSVSAEAPTDGEADDKADLVIVDVYMPRQAGVKTLRAVEAAHPGVPLIAISSQFRPGLVGSCTAAEALGVREVIAKPFSRTDLLAAVRSVIGPAGRLTNLRPAMARASAQLTARGRIAPPTCVLDRRHRRAHAPLRTRLPTIPGCRTTTPSQEQSRTRQFGQGAG